jgi:protein disulfide-isomerase A1
LAPIWDELAEKLQHVDDLVIAKMDATANDIPPGQPFQIEGFPTLKLFRSKTNEVVDFFGDRSLEGFVKFLKENVSDNIELKEDESKEQRDEL